MNETRRFKGIAYWEKSTNAHVPLYSYLGRNLRRALDRHQQVLLLGRGHDPAVESAGAGDEYRFAGWKFPTTNMFNEIAKSIAPMIRIDKVALRHTASGQVKPTRHRKQSSRAGSPDWLPAAREWKVPCQLSVRLMYQTAPKSTIYHSLRRGYIVRHDHPTKEPAFEIVPESPFEIPLASMEVFVDYKDSNGKNQWKLARDDDKVFMEFRIQCNGSAQSAELWSQLEHRDISDYTDMASDEGHMRITWKNLPDLPSSGSLLDLKRSHSKKLKETRYKAEVNMTWTQECQPFVVWNRAWQLQQQEISLQLPTPSVSDDSERPRKMRVQYLNHQGLSAAETGLHCVVSSCRERAEHSSLERLMLHYAIHHDHMKFEISPERSREDLAVIFMSSTENTSSILSSRKQQFSWQAPESPFDIEAHLKGTKPWAVTHFQTKDRSANNTPQRSPRKRAQGGELEHSSHIPISLGRSKATFTRPEDVLDLPKVPRRRHKVPRVENISFYRTLSKQQVPAGEEISDSEMEADMEWAVQVQRHEQTLLGIDRVTQDFNTLFDKHLDKEQPMSDMFTQEAIVRFARKYTPQLKQQKWKELFNAKLEQFEDKNIIRPSTVTYCMDLLATPAQAEAETVHGRNVRGTFVRGGVESECRTPERRRAMSPPSQISTNRRVRWRDGIMSQDERDAAANGGRRNAPGSLTPVPAGRRRQTIPLGRRKIICRRGSKASELHPMSDFLRDDKRDVPHDEIKPSELELAKFKRVLDDELLFMRSAHIIVCVSVAPANPIRDEGDWVSALERCQTDGGSRNIEFELRPRSSLEVLLTDIAKAERVGGDGPAGKKVGNRESECVCGVKAEGMRGIVACGKPKCPRQFHLSCLHLQQRPANEWLCVDCR